MLQMQRGWKKLLRKQRLSFLTWCGSGWLLLGQKRHISQVLVRAQPRHRRCWVGLGLESTAGLSVAALKAHPGVGLKLAHLPLFSSSSCLFPYARCTQTQPMGTTQLEELLDGYGIIMWCSLVIPHISTCLKTRRSIFHLCKEYPQIFLESTGPPQCVCVCVILYLLVVANSILSPIIRLFQCFHICIVHSCCVWGWMVMTVDGWLLIPLVVGR